MKQRGSTQTGLVLYAATSLLVVAGGAFVAAYRPGSTREAPPVARLGARAETSSSPSPVFPPPVPTEQREVTAVPRPDPSERAAALVGQLVMLLGRDPSPEAELAAVQAELVALGERAAPAMIQRIDALGRTAPETVRGRLFDVLRRLPGQAVEDRLIREARSGSAGSIRALSIEALGNRPSARAVDALARIAETDADLPARPLITVPRDPSDISTELPDETVFTPRMQAMAALAATRDARAGDVLTGVLHDGPNEALRIEAARRLEVFRETPSTVDALRAAATGDPSPYVRLAALHSLVGSTDRTLAPMLENIAARDTDAGVRALARQVLASLLP